MPPTSVPTKAEFTLQDLQQQPRRRLTASSVPWLHHGFQNGGLDPARVAQDLARFIDEPSDSAVVAQLTRFFSGICEFDHTACELRPCSSELDTEFRALSAFHHLGISPLPVAPPPPNKAMQKWITEKLTPMVLADRLAWLAQPDLVAVPFAARPITAKLMESEIKMADWSTQCKAAHTYWKANPKAFTKPETPDQYRNPFAVLREIGTKMSGRTARLNLETLVLTIRAYLMGDPRIGHDSRLAIVQQHATSAWPPECIQAAVDDTPVHEVTTALFVSCLFYSAAVLTRNTLIRPPSWAMVQTWMARGNLHYQFPNQTIYILDRKFWALALKAALGRLPNERIVPEFFNDPIIATILQTAAPEADLRCLYLPTQSPADQPGLLRIEDASQEAAASGSTTAYYEFFEVTLQDAPDVPAPAAGDYQVSADAVAAQVPPLHDHNPRPRKRRRTGQDADPGAGAGADDSPQSTSKVGRAARNLGSHLPSSRPRSLSPPRTHPFGLGGSSRGIRLTGLGGDDADVFGAGGVEHDDDDVFGDGGGHDDDDVFGDGGVKPADDHNPRPTKKPRTTGGDPPPPLTAAGGAAAGAKITPAADAPGLEADPDARPHSDAHAGREAGSDDSTHSTREPRGAGYDREYSPLHCPTPPSRARSPSPPPTQPFGSYPSLSPSDFGGVTIRAFSWDGGGLGGDDSAVRGDSGVENDDDNPRPKKKPRTAAGTPAPALTPTGSVSAATSPPAGGAAASGPAPGLPGAGARAKITEDGGAFAAAPGRLPPSSAVAGPAPPLAPVGGETAGAPAPAPGLGVAPAPPADPTPAGGAGPAPVPAPSRAPAPVAAAAPSAPLTPGAESAGAPAPTPVPRVSPDPPSGASPSAPDAPAADPTAAGPASADAPAPAPAPPPVAADPPPAAPIPAGGPPAAAPAPSAAGGPPQTPALNPQAGAGIPDAHKSTLDDAGGDDAGRHDAGGDDVGGDDAAGDDVGGGDAAGDDVGGGDVGGGDAGAQTKKSKRKSKRKSGAVVSSNRKLRSAAKAAVPGPSDSAHLPSESPDPESPKPAAGPGKSSKASNRPPAKAQSSKAPIPSAENAQSSKARHKARQPRTIYEPIPWLAVSDRFEVPQERDCETYLKQYQDFDQHLDPCAVYDLAPDEDVVPIPYYSFEVAADGLLKHTRKVYHWRPFLATRGDAPKIRKIVQSQPTRLWNGEQVPLHVHPDAQRLHTSGSTVDAEGLPFMPNIVPNDEQSVFYVCVDTTWDKLDAVQQLAVMRDRGVYSVSREPTHPQVHKFDIEGFAAFTNVSRLANIHDLGARPDGGGPVHRPGRPADLLLCVHKRESLGEDAVTGQCLNLLANRMPDMTTPAPKSWINLATHEFACQYLRDLPAVPFWQFPWEETNWSIFATARAFTWAHQDVLFTLVTLPAGEKLWFVARRRTDLARNDHRGNMFSRHAFDGFNGWFDNTDVWVYEMVHLGPNTALYLPATHLHCVMTMKDSIGAGRHGVPSSNITNVVLVTLHNTIVSPITTNADHEPARRFLLRIFIFVALALTDPHHEHFVDVEQHRQAASRMDGEAQQEYNADIDAHTVREKLRRLLDIPQRVLDHLPPLYIAEGALDYLALQSFIVLYVALLPTLYAHKVSDGIRRGALPIPADLWTELQYAWSLVILLTRWIDEMCSFVVLRRPGEGGDSPDSFRQALDMTLVAMSASLVQYHGATHKTEWAAEDRAEGFDTASFQQQIIQMLARFELRRQWHDSDHSLSPAPAFGIDDPLTASDLRTFPLVAALLESLDNDQDDKSHLIPWTPKTLPFRLSPD
ncbi:hypothetical protein K438DRAFT_1975934 [Mycena galopus ATCC 62051]|nr:hypothetical protein K438DRAFT_1975934 [Mycena galopus ATCC 62051]